MTLHIDQPPSETARTAVVTGCAGFIGSHLSERLVADGIRVIGIDSFRDFYPRTDKDANLDCLRNEPAFDLVEADLLDVDMASIFRHAGVVFHLAAQAGVRDSFGSGFNDYAADNLVATQRVFEGAANAQCRRVVWASSSSVYGNANSYPCIESTTPTAPRSPYGVTKRACEDLARVYGGGQLSLVGLRYFTVYGPRQRPDMAIRRMCEVLVNGGSFPLYGDGSQTRDMTYVDDVVEATVLAARSEQPDAIYNVGGGAETSIARIIEILEELAGQPLTIDRFEVQRGDVRRTGADTTRAQQTLGWRPLVSLPEGLHAALQWVQARGAAADSDLVGAGAPVIQSENGGR